MEHQEVEVKFRVADLEPIRRKLRLLGAACEGSKHEINVVFDDAAGRLKTAGELLRLRRAGGVTLTFKSPIPDPHLKVRRELEVEVSSFETTRAILEALGYRAVAGYEKDRETWRLAGASILLDRLDFGCFVEVEGEPAAIERAAAFLGFDLAEGITKSYLQLQEEAA